MNDDLISREELKKKIEFFKSGHNAGTDYENGIIDGYDFCLDEIDNAPTVKQPTGEVNCSHCDYWNFSQKIIDIIVEVMTKYGMESVEDLQRELNRLKGGEEE